MKNTENECIIDGVKYVSEKSGNNCFGCAGEGSKLCIKLPECSNADRHDNRDVIFVKFKDKKGE